MSDIGQILGALGRIDASLASRGTDGQGGPTPKQLRILEELDEDDPVMVTELADVLGVTPSTMSLNLRRLVETGAVARERDPADRRVMNVRLTSAGKAVLDRAQQRSVERLAAALERLHPHERRRVVEGVTLLAESSEAVAR
ncbi:MAG: MarR family transcriptional regulator [Gemmatimonadota bacterium]